MHEVAKEHEGHMDRKKSRRLQHEAVSLCEVVQEVQDLEERLQKSQPRVPADESIQTEC